MNDSEWEGRDEELLNLLGNVRHNDNTTMGTQYNVLFYEGFAERLSGIVHASISPEDVGDRIKKFSEIFQSYHMQHEDEESVLATQPGSNTSSGKTVSRAHCSRLLPDIEQLVQEEIAELENRNMLTMTHISFSEPYLSQSTWAAVAFLNKKTWEKKRDYILKAYKFEVERKEKRRMKMDGPRSCF